MLGKSVADIMPIASRIFGRPATVDECNFVRSHLLKPAGNTWYWNRYGMGLGAPIEAGDGLETGTRNHVELTPGDMLGLEEKP